MKLQATTLLETIVSSLVFLIVFGLAIASAVRINKVSHPDWVRLEKDFNAYRDTLATRGAGVYEVSRPWGKMIFEKECLEERGLWEITMSATLQGGLDVKYHYLSNE